MVWIQDPYDRLKPRKKLYSVQDQKRIFEKVKKILKKEFDKNKYIKEILVFGSLVNGTFGVYERPTRNKREGSDIDVFIIVDDDFECDWKLMKEFPGGDKYFLGTVEKIHWIQAFTYNPNKDDYKDALAGSLPVTKTRRNKAKVLFSRTRNQ